MYGQMYMRPTCELTQNIEQMELHIGHMIPYPGLNGLVSNMHRHMSSS